MEKNILKFKPKEFINMINHIFLKFNILFNDLKQNKKTIEVFTKEDNEKFTNFDWCFQKIIENYLNQYFSSMKFIGEENTSDVKVKNDFSEFLTTVDKISFNPVSEISTDDNSVLYDQKDLCIYCDPIDGTSSFIKGKYSNVTVLIGVTYKQQPILGLIHFLSYLDKEPKTFFNIPGNGIYSLTTNLEQLLSMKNSDYSELEYNLNKEDIVKGDKMNFIITASRENPTMSKSNFLTFNFILLFFYIYSNEFFS